MIYRYSFSCRSRDYPLDMSTLETEQKEGVLAFPFSSKVFDGQLPSEHVSIVITVMPQMSLIACEKNLSSAPEALLSHHQPPVIIRWCDSSSLCHMFVACDCA